MEPRGDGAERAKGIWGVAVPHGDYGPLGPKGFRGGRPELVHRKQNGECGVDGYIIVIILYI